MKNKLNHAMKTTKLPKTETQARIQQVKWQAEIRPGAGGFMVRIGGNSSSLKSATVNWSKEVDPSKTQ
jgi:hypothetical protein